jgi:hypothetical protein
MATDIKVVKTVFVVDTADVKKATNDYDALAKSIDNTGKELTDTGKKASEGSQKVKDGLDKSKQSVSQFKNSFDGIGNAIAGAFAIGSIVAFGKSVIDITSQVQKYRAVLTNTLGSQNLADMAMGMISDTAIKTNFSVMELTDTYIKFANRGLKLTSSEMMKLADIANSTGKSIDQLTEATLDAFTGENERLKEFGITAKKTGETTQYTFKGVTTEVKNTQEAIKGYLLGLGELEGVMGSTNAISQTLGGQISNLGDKWDKFLTGVGSRTSAIFGGAISFIADRLDFLEELLKSKEAEMSESTVKSNNNTQANITKFFESVKAQSEKSRQDEAKAMEEGYNNKKAIYDKETKQAIENLSYIAGVKLTGQKELDSGLLAITKSNASEEKLIAIQGMEEDLKIARFKNEELKRQYDAYIKSREVKTKVLTEKEIKARELAQKKIVDDAINLLHHEEKIAKQKAINVGANTTDILMIEDEFNYKRIQIYNEYSSILNKKQKQDQESTIINVDTLATKIIESDKKLIEERKKANDEWSKTINEQHLKEEQDLEKSLDRKSSIEQNKIGLKKDAELTKMYEDGNLTVKEKLQKRQEIEDYYANWSATQQIESDEERLKLLTLNSEEYIALERKIADEKVALNKDANEKILEEDKATAEKRKEVTKQGLSLLEEGINAVYSYKKNVNDQELIDLKDKEERELKLAGDNQEKKEAIAKKYEALQAEVRRKQFEQNKQIALINVAINTAEAISKANPNIPLMAFAGVSGLIQAGLINSQPTPKFAKGVIDLQGKGTGTSDEIHAMLSKGESVMTADETSKFKPLLQSIRRKELSPELANMMLNGQKMSNINLNTDSLARELRGMPKNHISIDKDGFKTFLYSENLKQESLNNRYLS